jgi:hypothetical protein
MTESSETVSEKLAEYRRQIAELREKIRQVQASSRRRPSKTIPSPPSKARCAYRSCLPTRTLCL